MREPTDLPDRQGRISRRLLLVIFALVGAICGKLLTEMEAFKALVR